MKRGLLIILIVISIILLVLISYFILQQDRKQETTCEEFCKQQPHVACVGSWNISGAYPDCNCEFICETKEVSE